MRGQMAHFREGRPAIAGSSYDGTGGLNPLSSGSCTEAPHSKERTDALIDDRPGLAVARLVGIFFVYRPEPDMVALAADRKRDFDFVPGPDAHERVF